MSKHSHSLTQPESRNTSSNVAKTTLGATDGLVVGKAMAPSGIATECIKSSMATAGEWSQALNVSERTVQRWRSGQERIPRERVSQIIWAAKRFLNQIDSLKLWVDEALVSVYGPTARINQEKGWE